MKFCDCGVKAGNASNTNKVILPIQIVSMLEYWLGALTGHIIIFVELIYVHMWGLISLSVIEPIIASHET